MTREASVATQTNNNNIGNRLNDDDDQENPFISAKKKREHMNFNSLLMPRFPQINTTRTTKKLT
jgi:hypothetical protein